MSTDFVSSFCAGHCHQHHSTRDPKTPVSQDQDGGYQHDPVRSHPPHPQWRIHVLPVPQYWHGWLTGSCTVSHNVHRGQDFFCPYCRNHYLFFVLSVVIVLLLLLIVVRVIFRKNCVLRTWMFFNATWVQSPKMLMWKCSEDWSAGILLLLIRNIGTFI